ncbi:hypothetical protein [Thalassoroseus pseudoceratinae]|uniref:hypothetical protein n=1 Tax=Thalassoroseus pseudoceratinae TaxID=2713176 RepID=UPI00141DAE60|nr:hypothetical protein [Thalassoroseus pseudoceratinae]
MIRSACCMILAFAFVGCSTVEVGVSNPIPGLSRVAVVPFFNLSMEPAADGHRFAEAYFTELQRTPGFEVVPVGVADAAMQDHGLNLNNPGDALKLAKILDVDAIVVGAITAYDPYYPPRVGLRVAWYSPYEWNFSPGLPTDPRARAPIFPPTIVLPALPDGSCDGPKKPGRRFGRHRDLCEGPQSPDTPQSPVESCTEDVIRGQSPDEIVVWDETPVTPVDPTRPLMSYSRIFDGADSALTAALRDYVELNGDLRSGGWEAYLHRSDDFLQFTARLMIDEMLMLHGGETRRRVVFAHRKQR